MTGKFPKAEKNGEFRVVQKNHNSVGFLAQLERHVVLWTVVLTRRIYARTSISPIFNVTG